GGDLHVLAGQGGQRLADGGGAGEGDLADDRMPDEIVGNLRRHAIDQIDGTGRYAGVDIAAYQFGHGCRRILRPLEDDGTAGRQGDGNLAHGLVERKIPRRECRHRADRLLDHHLLHVVAPRRDDTAVDAARLFGEPLQRAGSADRFALGLGQRLALLHGHERGDDVGTLAQQCGGFLQRSEEHTSELQSRFDLVCRLLLEKKNYRNDVIVISYYAASG